MDTVPDPGFPLYHRIAAKLERAIDAGSLRTGDRLPSVRQLCQQHAISASTATLAYRWLENRALVEARPKSGYFVAPRHAALPEPELDLRMGSAGFVTPDEITREFLLASRDPLAAPSFYSAVSRSLLPEAKLRHLLARQNRLHPEYASTLDITGSPALRQELARRGVQAGSLRRDIHSFCRLTNNLMHRPFHRRLFVPVSIANTSVAALAGRYAHRMPYLNARAA